MKDYRPEANHLLSCIRGMKEDDARREIMFYLENADNNGYKRKEEEDGEKE